MKLAEASLALIKEDYAKNEIGDPALIAGAPVYVGVKSKDSVVNHVN